MKIKPKWIQGYAFEIFSVTFIVEYTVNGILCCGVTNINEEKKTSEKDSFVRRPRVSVQNGFWVTCCCRFYYHVLWAKALRFVFVFFFAYNAIRSEIRRPCHECVRARMCKVTVIRSRPRHRDSRLFGLSPSFVYVDESHREQSLHYFLFLGAAALPALKHFRCSIATSREETKTTSISIPTTKSRVNYWKLNEKQNFMRSSLFI